MNTFVPFFLGGFLSQVSENAVIPTTIPLTDPNLSDVADKVIQTAPQVIQPQMTFGQQLVIAGLTILGGAIVYVLGQITTKFIIEPIHEQKKVISEIADAIIFYANKYYSVIEAFTPEPLNVSVYPENRKLMRKLVEKESDKKKLISDRLRGLGTQLVSKTYLIPFYRLFSRLSIVKPFDKIVKAQKGLIGLSNMVGDPDVETRLKFEKEVRDALSLFHPESK